MGRSGDYPAPPYWPEKLCASESPVIRGWRLDIDETDAVVHAYILDGWPGPCVITFSNEGFMDWWPCLSIKRAERAALAL